METRPALFRQEAIDFLRQRHSWGEVVALQPLSTTILSWIFSGVILLIIWFLCVAPYARKETVVGYLTPSSGTAKIFVPQQGFIKEIKVKEGQEVAEGHPLLTVVTSQITASGDDVNATVLEVLRQQRNVVERQIAAEERRTTSERDRLVSSINGIKGEIAQLEDQRNIQNERLKLSEGFVATGAKLTASGTLAPIELKRREQAALEQKQSVVSLDQQITARRSQLTDTQHTLEQLPAVVAERVRVLRSDLSSIEQRVAEVNGRQAYVIKAPTSGRVSTLQATVGQVADPKQMQLEIIPLEAQLQAQLFFPTRAFGFVRPGQPVRLLYDAFPYQKFGAYGGRVTDVSHAVLTPNETTGPITLKEPAYRVTVALDRPDIDAYGRKMPLQPDMLLRADVILEQRSLIRWLLDPVLSARM
jgi:membrane fusion protein